MHLATVVVLMLVLPVTSVVAEKLVLLHPEPWMELIGRWFVFWGVGVRLLLAGAVQTGKPEITARIFDASEPSALAIVRELGFANIAMGTLGIATLGWPGSLVPAAVVGGLFYGLAGAGHTARGGGNFREQVAMYSDLLMFALLAIFVAWSMA
jgi:hypothetical protein